jgi:hypothetical protein
MMSSWPIAATSHPGSIESPPSLGAVGFLENQRKKRHETSVNWYELVTMMLLDHELELAAHEGVAENVQAHRAAQIRDAVVERVGRDRVVRAFIDCDYEMKTSDKDAVVLKALEVSGYDEVRRELPPDLLAASMASPAGTAGGLDEPRWDDEPIVLEAEPPRVPRREAEMERPRVPEPEAPPPFPPSGVAMKDAQARDVATRAVRAWLTRFPEVARQAHDSDGGRTDRSTMLAEAYSAAEATRGLVASGDSALTMFEKQSSIAFSQAEEGVTKEWVVAYMQIRCISTGYMLETLGCEATMRHFARLFRDFFAK